uniref:Uncharacterized protein n=1 Tax=Strongyloides papillosus TaxID=174720 RepID=A0A0N5B4T2_STREA
MKIYSTSLIFSFFTIYLIAYNNGQENQELVDFAQKVFVNVNNLTNILQEGKQTDIGTLRKSISSILGGGLLGQIAENPIRLADHFGIDLDNFGFNRTILEQTIGIETDKSKENYDTSKGDQIFNLKNIKNAPAEVTTQPPTTTTTIPPTTIEKITNTFDSVLLDDFGNVLPMTSFVQENKNFAPPSSSLNIQVPSYSLPQQNTMHNQQKLHQQPQLNSSPTVTAKIDEIQEIKEQLKKLEQLLILKEFTQKYPDLAEKIVASNSPKTQQSQPQPIQQQYIPPNHYQNIPSQVNQQPQPTQTSSFVELSKPSPIVRANYVPVVYKVQDVPLQHPKVIEKPKKSSQRSSRLSLLQNQPRYPYKKINQKEVINYNNDENIVSKQSQSSLQSTSDVKCECLDVEMDQLRGSWTKAMSSGKMITKFKKIVGKMFGMEGKMELTCSAFTIIPSDNDEETAKIQWTFRTPNSKRPFKINGILKLINEKRTALVTFTDFNGFVTEIPLCILKNSDPSENGKMNNYIVVVENNLCSEPLLMISNPQNFFDQVDHELIKYLKHMIQSGQFSTMDVVSTGETCSDM